MTVKNQQQTDHSFTREYLDYVREFFPNPQQEFYSRTNELRNVFIELEEDCHTWQAIALKFGGQDAQDEYEADRLKATSGNERKDIPF